MTLPNPISDEQLLARFARGDRGALGTLAERHESNLVGLAAGRVDGRVDLAQDAVQESWLRVIKYSRSFEGKSSFRTWVYRVVINRCREMMEKAGGRVVGSGAESAMVESEAAPESANPLRLVSAEAGRDSVRGCAARVERTGSLVGVVVLSPGADASRSRGRDGYSDGDFEIEVECCVGGTAQRARRERHKGGCGMSGDHVNNLDVLLADATAGPTCAPSLWRAALEVEESQRSARVGGTARAGGLGAWRVPPLLSVAAVVVLMVVVIGAVVPSLGKARASSRGVSSYAPSDGGSHMDSRWIDRSSVDTEYQQRVIGGAPSTGAVAVTVADTRHVIRKLTIDLTTADVRSVFPKAGLVINEALGEYVETSSVTGNGPTTSATMTLRVAASRVSEVMNQLRALGVVTAETANGEDVTDTVLDLEARIRNEERIERELLELIDKRPDAPLKDVLEIRDQLAQVRGQIESLVGQRERIGRFVALATVLVSIRTENAVVEVKSEGIGAYVVEGVEQAWERSFRTLADSAAFLIRTLVGGLVWWVVIGVYVIGLWKLVKRAVGSGAREPAPVG